MKPYHISTAVVEDTSENASQETAHLASLPNCRINAKRRARQCFHMNQILLLSIFYLLTDVPSTYQQRKYKLFCGFICSCTYVLRSYVQF